MRHILLFIFVLISGIIDAQANNPEEGYAIIRSDTIRGMVKINFEAGSILIQQDTINRMFLSDIEQVTLLNDKRETFIPVYTDEHTTFYKVLVKGDHPLLEAGEMLFTTFEGNIIQINEERDLYDLFGKRDIKDYIFLRNIQLTEINGMIDVFRYFNKHESF